LLPTEFNETQRLACSLVNLGDKPIVVTFEIFGRDGGRVPDPFGLVVETIPPGRSEDLSAPGNTFPNVCKFSGTFSKAKVRASASIINFDGKGTTAALQGF
jgi:hypothetical protein